MRVSLHVTQDAALSLASESPPSLKVAGDYVGDPSPVYEGAYECIPSWSEQAFPTLGRKMEQDFSVYAIPTYEVDNDAGGVTLTI